LGVDVRTEKELLGISNHGLGPISMDPEEISDTLIYSSTLITDSLTKSYRIYSLKALNLWNFFDCMFTYIWRITESL
jgi:hypothetical protein